METHLLKPEHSTTLTAFCVVFHAQSEYCIENRHRIDDDVRVPMGR